MMKNQRLMRHDLNALFNTTKVFLRADREAQKRSWVLLKKHYTEEELDAQGIKESYDWCDQSLSSLEYRHTPSASAASVQTPPVVNVEASSSSSSSAPTPPAPAPPAPSPPAAP